MIFHVHTFVQLPHMPGSRSRTILIGGLIGGGGATVVILLTIALTYRRRRRNRNMTPRTTGNTLKRLPPKGRPTLVEPFMEQYPTNQTPSRSLSTRALVHRRSASAASHESESSLVPSVAAPATVGVSEVVPTRNTLEDAREEERFVRRVRKFRDQVADLRRWAEQRRSSRPSTGLDI